MNPLIQAIALGVIRNLAMAAGALMVSDGLINANQQNDVVGSLICLGGVAFTVIDKVKVKDKIAEAHATPADEPLPASLS